MKNKNFKADTTLTSSQALINKLVEKGWRYTEQARSQPRDEHNIEKIGIFQREIENPKKEEVNKYDYRHVTEKKSVTRPPSKNADFKPFSEGGENNYGRPIVSAAPTLPDVGSSSSSSSSLAHSLSEITSISRMRKQENSLVLALDTEFYYVKSKLSSKQRVILTWQFAFVVPTRPNYIQEVIFCSTSGRRIPFSFIISWLLRSYDFSSLYPDGFSSFDFRSTRFYIYHTVTKSGSIVKHITPDLSVAIAKSTLDGERAILSSPEARHKARPNAFSPNGIGYVDESRPVCGYVNNFKDSNKFSLPVTLLCHAGSADLTSLLQIGSDDFLPRLSQVQGGLISLSSFFVHAPLVDKYWHFFPISLTVRDTMCFAPAGSKSLAALGNTVGIPKLVVSHSDKDNMLAYLLREPANFAEYAINDSVITLCFACELWGYNKSMPATVSGAAVSAVVPTIAQYLGVPWDGSKSSREAYNIAFRGLHTVKKGLIMNDKAGFIENTCLEPVSDKARILQTYAQHAYKGGYNGSCLIGKFDGVLTHDYDLENAYPTCMALIPDVDWTGSVIADELFNCRILKQHFHSPFDLMFGYIKFRFPDDVKFPCIPVAVNGSMIFPRSSDGLDGVYASAPEIYLALQLGAEVWAEHIYIGEYLYNSDGNISFSLLQAVQQLVKDRNLAKASFGKKSLPELLLKTAVCSIYGKTAQDLIDKESWNAFCDRMVNIGGSSITSPTHACLTTAGVRCVLLAALNELSDLGYKVYSVTTDGFITDAPKIVLDSLNLFGFSRLFRTARQALVGSDEMWSEKHHQTDLLNFTTRGNVSLSSDGVCAHNSFVTGFEKDSYEDRLALMTVVLGRTGRCHCSNKTWTKFRRLAARVNREDFSVTERERALSMDFDLKRKPVKSSFYTVFPVIKTADEEQQFEIANFETAPYETVSEYLRYKNAGKSCTVLRTEADWALFFAKVERTSNGGVRQLTDLDWSKLFTCVMGYRLGLWDIPYLNTSGLTVKDKVEWINKFNKSKKQFSENTWKDCRKHNRASQMLEKIIVEDLLIEMQTWTKGDD